MLLTASRDATMGQQKQRETQMEMRLINYIFVVMQLSDHFFFFFHTLAPPPPSG